MLNNNRKLAQKCALLMISTILGGQAYAQTQAGTENTAAETIDQVRDANKASAAQTYAVTIALLEELIKSGVISAERAQALLDHAERQAGLARQAEAAAQPSSTVRVPYISETVKNQIRDELRGEITQQAKSEGWGVPNSLPGWLSRIDWSGDFRIRYHGDFFSSGNFPFFPNVQAINDAGGVTTANGLPFINSTDDRHRVRYRARLNLKAKISDWVNVGFSLASGDDNGPISTNKTLGDYMRKDAIWLDRAYVELTPIEGLKLTGGRMPNPFFSTDLVWDGDLNFEGVAVSGSHDFDYGSGATIFATAGAFPLQESSINPDRWLFAGQIGGTVPVGDVSIKLGAAYYDYHNIQSLKNPPAGSKLNDYSKPLLLGQGNSVFNMRTDGLTTLAGLASDFRLLNLTGQVDYKFGEDKIVRFTGDFVKNLGMDKAEIDALRGEPGVEPGDIGWQAKLYVGSKRIKQLHDWSVEVAYKRLETDAVLDAFTDSDFGAYGGTDLKGYTIEGTYGLANNTWIALKWLSSDSISRPPFSADVLLLDLNTRF